MSWAVLNKLKYASLQYICYTNERAILSRYGYCRIPNLNLGTYRSSAKCWLELLAWRKQGMRELAEQIHLYAGAHWRIPKWCARWNRITANKLSFLLRGQQFKKHLFLTEDQKNHCLLFRYKATTLIINVTCILLMTLPL